mmetsp:Transcript_108890/g.162876  ORF Transcript_108890/g.162876 Transcript_108890/m.162876 type:complete len:353 (+) Transcript_108890:2-1060(+)
MIRPAERLALRIELRTPPRETLQGVHLTMGVSPEVRLIVKHTFLEFVEAASTKVARARAFTDTALLKDADTSSGACAHTSEENASAPASGATRRTIVRVPPPVLEAEDAASSPQKEHGDLIDEEATMEVKAVLGMGPSPAQQQALWWLPSDLDLFLEPGLEVHEACTGTPGPQRFIASRPQAATSSTARPLFGSTGRGAGVLSAQDGTRTTVMIRGLPASSSRATLLQILDANGLAAQYNFVYVPVDFSTGTGLGYALVNLTSPAAAACAWAVLDGLRVGPGPEVCSVCWSHPHQGLAAHLERYVNSPVMHHSVPDAWKPAVFSGGLRVAFPRPTRAIKAPKVPRARRPDAA